MTTYFVALGELSAAHGCFHSSEWNEVQNWLSARVDSILFYGYLTNECLRSKFSEGFLRRVVPEVPFDGEACSLFGYHCGIQTERDWDEVHSLRICPENGVSHVFYYQADRLIAELEVDDDLNFMCLSLDESERSDLASKIPDIERSRRLCEEWRPGDGVMVEGECWEPL